MSAEQAHRAAYQRWSGDPALERLIQHAVRAWPARKKAERVDSVMDVACLAFAAGWDAAKRENTNAATKHCAACGKVRALHELVTPELINMAICKDSVSCTEAKA